MKKIYTEQLISGACISGWGRRRTLWQVQNEPKFTTDSPKRARPHFPSIKKKYIGSYTSLKYLMLLNWN